MDFNYLRTELEQEEGVDHVINTIKDYAERVSSPGKRAGFKNRIVLVASHYNGVFKTNPLGYNEETKLEIKKQVIIELTAIIDDLEENFKAIESIKTKVSIKDKIIKILDKLFKTNKKTLILVYALFTIAIAFLLVSFFKNEGNIQFTEILIFIIILGTGITLLATNFEAKGNIISIKDRLEDLNDEK